MIQHKEFTFRVLAPMDIAVCQQQGCKHPGDWSVVALDDQDKVLFKYENICELHILQAFLDAASGEY